MEIVHLHSDFDDKDIVKAYGAKWDKENKTWYTTEEFLPGLVDYIKVYLLVAFDDKDKVKELGAKWDKEMGLWYTNKANTALSRYVLNTQFKNVKGKREFYNKSVTEFIRNN